MEYRSGNHPPPDFESPVPGLYPNQIELPLIEEGSYGFSVDWGDGTSDSIKSWDASERVHTYPSAGTYTVIIRGEISGWSFKLNEYESMFPQYGGSTRYKFVQTPRLIEISRFGPLTLGYAGGQFYGCEDLTVSATDSPQFIANADLSNAFNGCTFSDAVEMNHWQTDSVANMAGMFAGATNFNLPIDNWNTHNVKDMNQMFSGASLFNQDISSWNTGNVESMDEMFRGASSFNQDVGSWNTGNVESMDEMFRGASSFNQDVSAWQIENVANMSGMFGGATLETDIYDNILDAWSAQTVQTGVDVSFGYSKFTSYAARQKLIEEDGWRITDGGIGAEPGTGTIPAIPQTDPFISSWSMALPNQGVSIRLPLVENGEYFFEVEWGDGQKHIVTSWNDPNATHFIPGSPDSNTDDTTQVKITGQFSGWQLRCGGGLPTDCCMNDDNIWFGEPWSGESSSDYHDCCSLWPVEYGCCESVRSRPSHLVEISQWGALALGPTDHQFIDCDGINFTATDAPDLSETTSLHSIFENCNDLTGLASLNLWDVSGITDLSRMFYAAGSQPFLPDPTLNPLIDCPNISDWDTSNVTNMSEMFAMMETTEPCTIDLSNWDTSSVVNTGAMFWAASFDVDDISSWNTSSVTSMNGMFFDANIIDLNDISNWNIENVEHMNYFFEGGTTLTPEVYDNILNSWAAQNVQVGVVFGAEYTKYTSAGADARQRLIDEFGWTITDGGMI